MRRPLGGAQRSVKWRSKLDGRLEAFADEVNAAVNKQQLHLHLRVPIEVIGDHGSKAKTAKCHWRRNTQPAAWIRDLGTPREFGVGRCKQRFATWTLRS